MGYYIQGNATNAEKIKAAFEAKAIYSNLNFANENYLYYSCDGTVAFCFIGGGLANIIKTHPDYKELELPVEPNFKVGDWIVRSNGSSDVPIQVYDLEKDIYLVTNMLGSKGELMINRQNEWHLWTIEDAIDGDVLSFDNETIVVFKDMYNATSFHSHCHLEDGIFDVSTDEMPDWLRSDGFKPATKERHDILLIKMKEAGYTWDEKRKEVRKIIKPTFKVGDDIKIGNTIDTIAEVDYNTQSYYCESGRTISFENQDLWHLTPKFRVGDWVVFNDNHNSIYQISEIRDSYYMLTHTHGGTMPLSFSQVNLIRHWTIADAKDGDVLVDEDTNTIGIFGEIYGICWHSKIYCSNYNTISTVYHQGGSHEIKFTKPATKEQRDLLFAKMREAGYEWDAEKKELKEFPKHYDIANFKPKQWVLVRDDDEWEWALTRFSYLSYGSASLFVCINGASFQQCIPFEGNETLLGTTDMCNERFINW